MNKHWAEIQGWVRCKCGRYADSDGIGQCQVCGDRAACYTDKCHMFTLLLCAAITAIFRVWDPEIEI